MDNKILTREDAFKLLNWSDHALTRQERDSIIATVHEGEVHLACDLLRLLLFRHLELNRNWLSGHADDDRQVMKEDNLVPTRKEPLLRITRASARKLLRSLDITIENQAKLLVACRKNLDLCREVLDTLMTTNNIWVEGLDDAGPW